ncbi:helix-turn-helix domain-containing protein [Bradyrhizobium quebecense]|uniref:Helix-turn-helix transcriptional regulator n=1 Tax=Bradyrhizobium quebecense TaxID=2748629 RepID=A0A973WN74_9BRAD|nr:helix-turn-helix transcriptional regulator [Bradyrhizobium quebecense]UGA46515.1 helix-turn-helix domain-containing protein [Bradyrhizobium quebecense]
MTSVLSRFGQRCRDLRISRGLTMGDQAKHIGCSVNEISLIECGSRTPSEKYLEGFRIWMKLDDEDFQELKKKIRSNVVELNRVKSLGEHGRSMRLFRKISKMNPEEIRAFNRPPDSGARNER